MMTTKDYAFLSILGVLALFIWLRDLAWVSTADDTLPILVTLPMFWWLGTPWTLQPEFRSPSPVMVGIATVLFLAGLVTNITLLLAIAWTTLLWSWLSQRASGESLATSRKLLILPLMAFPWVALDANPVGWWFRLSAAGVAGGLFSAVGLNVQQQGTNLVINAVPISIDVACAGLNTLQSMLIAGSVGAFVLLGHTNRYWWNLPMLAAMAWLANTLRIIILCAVALAISPEFAMGPFHEIGGWAVLMIMFLLCWLIFSWQVPDEKPKAPPGS